MDHVKIELGNEKDCDTNRAQSPLMQPPLVRVADPLIMVSAS
jgi:hypothetical protein